MHDIVIVTDNFQELTSKLAYRNEQVERIVSQSKKASPIAAASINWCMKLYCAIFNSFLLDFNFLYWNTFH